MRALEHRVHDLTAAERDEFEGGVAYRNRDLGAVWDLNFVRLDRPCSQPALWADRLQAGLGHRKVLVEDARLVARFGPGLRERGFAERDLIALARAAGGGRLDPEVRELSYDQVRPLRTQVIGEQLAAPDADVVAQVVAAGALSERAGGRWLALVAGDAPVSHCVVYSHDGLAQIEDVATLEAHRRHGFARRLIEHAVELVAADHDTVFIQAEAGDWPLAFYERLGFAPVERRADYLIVLARA